MIDQKREMGDLAKRLEVQDIDDALYFPKYIIIETTRLCNSRCPFCTNAEADKSVPMMSDKLFDKIAEEIGRYSRWIKFICVQRLGEPLIDKKIGERIRCLKSLGVRTVSMSTNAALLSADRAQEILEAGIDDVMISIDSIDKEKYEKMRIGLDYDTVMKNIKGFFKLRDSIKPDAIIRVRGVSFFDLQKKEHEHELVRWEEFWGKLRKPHDRIYMKRAHSWGNQKFWDDNIPEYDLAYSPCILLWSTIHITSSGIVPLCSMDYDGKMRMGDVNTESISEIWNNDKWKHVRGLHKNGERNQIHFCKGCKVFDLDFSLEKKH